MAGGVNKQLGWWFPMASPRSNAQKSGKHVMIGAMIRAANQERFLG